MSARPPKRFATESDCNLWFTTFELYAKEVKLPETEWVKELLALLEDAPFRVVTQAGLIGSTDSKVVKDCLQKRYAPDGNELEWQFRLHYRYM